MIWINRPQTDPLFNIAAEEFFLKNSTADIAMLWQCSPAVIVGKHQNVMREVNIRQTRESGIPVIRRITGGGTVYHDKGNLNYTVIRTVERLDRLIDFKAFTAPLIGFLETLGLQARFEGKNNLVLEGKKISGNSAHVFKHRVIHHGTILFDSNLENLVKSIQPSGIIIRDRAVRSIRAQVTNIRPHLPKEMTFDDFKVLLEKYMIKHHNISDIYDINSEEISAIKALAEGKYSKREWTYGYSPGYTIMAPLEINGQTLNATFRVKNGLIEDIAMDNAGDEFQSVGRILEKMKGLPHYPDDLDPYLRELAELRPELRKLESLLF